MNEWEVVGVMIALISFVTAIVAPIIKLNTTITKLTVIVDSLSNAQKKLDTDAATEHAKLWNSIGKQDEELHDHDKRITKLEGGVKHE